MAYDKKVIAEVNELFLRRREEAFSSLEQRRQEVYARSPQIQQLDQQLSLTTFTLAKEAVAGDLSPEKIQQLKEQNITLRSQRAELLVSLGYPFDYLKLKFHCPKCEDLGYVGSTMCSCYKEELVRTAYHQSVLASAVPDASFDAFVLDYYSPVPDATGVSPRDRMVHNFGICKQFAADFASQQKSLLMQGPTGLGKTFLSGCISKELVEQGVDVVYDTAHNIFSILEKEKFTNDELSHQSAQRFFDCDLLIIDDLGTEFISNFSVSALYNLINTRLLKKKFMIINTNCEMPELEKNYSSRIVSRFLGDFTLLKFCGQDIRFLKGMQS